MKIACVTPDNKRDYTCEQVLEGLHDLGHDLIVSDPGNGFCKRAMLDGDFREAADQCDAMLVFFGKQRGNRPPRRYFLDQVKLPKSHIAYVDGSEWSCTGWESGDQASAALINPMRRRGEPWIDEEMLKRCGWYFKRECYPQDIQRGIIPLPFAMCKRHHLEPRPFLQKDIDIFCSFGHEKTGLRREINQFMSKMRDNQGMNGLKIVVQAGMSKEQYKDHLCRSKVIIDAWGGGDTNDRMWEAIGAKALVLYQRHNVITQNPLEDWIHAVSYKNLDELSNAITVLFNDCHIEQIAENGFAHALNYHSARHRAEEIMKYVIP